MQPDKNQPIGVFDSGLGGLSILRELRELLPHENFIFLADQAYVPYGEKTPAELIDRCLKIGEFLKNQDIKLMVVACNTATCYALPALRQKYALLIVGTVPAIKPASEKTKTGVIGIISTEATSKSKTLADLITAHARDKQVINIGCPNLEDTVEAGGLDSTDTNALLEKYLEPIKQSSADCLVLGCTHYPFLKPAIVQVMEREIEIIDSGEAIAKRVKTLLANNETSASEGAVKYFTTSEPDQFNNIASKLLKEKIKAKTVQI